MHCSAVTWTSVIHLMMSWSEINKASLVYFMLEALPLVYFIEWGIISIYTNIPVACQSMFTVEFIVIRLYLYKPTKTMQLKYSSLNCGMRFFISISNFNAFIYFVKIYRQNKTAERLKLQSFYTLISKCFIYKRDVQ